jgi:alkylation response protein AidB-like acyl-CoA dehydrogenase
VKRDDYFDDTDAALADAAQRYTHDRHAFEKRQKLPAGERRFSPSAWNEMAAMGWLGVAIDEDHGGLGLRVSSIALLAQAAGKALMSEPLLSSGFIAPDIVMRHGSPAQRGRWLARMNQGALRVACVFARQDAPVRANAGQLHGRQEVVLDGDIADAVLVQAGEAGQSRWYWVEPDAHGVKRTAYPLLDGRGGATLEFEGCPADALEAGESPHPALLLALALCADAVGAMEAAMTLTLDYIKTRQQFGAAIGTHQVIQHRAVDMFIRLNECRAVLAQATQSLQARPGAAARDVHGAKAFVGEQSRLMLQEAVQLHGGIGITDEYALSHYLRRVIADDQLSGGAEQHLRAFVAAPSIR